MLRQANNAHYRPLPMLYFEINLQYYPMSSSICCLLTVVNCLTCQAPTATLPPVGIARIIQISRTPKIKHKKDCGNEHSFPRPNFFSRHKPRELAVVLPVLALRTLLRLVQHGELYNIYFVSFIRGLYGR